MKPARKWDNIGAGIRPDAGCTFEEMFSPPVVMAGTGQQTAMDGALQQYTTTLDGRDGSTIPMPPFLGYANLAILETHPLIRDIIETTGDEMVKKWVEFKIEQSGEKVAPDPKETLVAMAQGRTPEELHRETEDEKAKLDEIKLQQIRTAFEKFKIQSLFRDAAKRSHYMGGCVLFIDMGNDLTTDEGLKELQTPLFIDERKIAKGMFKGLRLIEPITIYPGPYNSTQPLAADFYKPAVWYVMGTPVHNSRLLFFIPNPLSFIFKPAYNFFGISTTQLVLDYVETFDSVRKDGANIVNKFSLTALATDLSQSLADNPTTEDAKLLASRAKVFNAARNNLGLLMIDKETEELTQLNVPITGLDAIAGKHLEFLAAAARIPAVKLLGISPSGFNATGLSDLKNWYDYIASHQEKLFRDPIETVLRIIQLNEFGSIDSRIAVDFPPLYEASPTEIAAEQKTKSDNGKVLIDGGVITPEEERRRIAADPNSGYNSIDPGNVPEPPEPQLPPEFMRGEDVPEQPDPSNEP